MRCVDHPFGNTRALPEARLSGLREAEIPRTNATLADTYVLQGSRYFGVRMRKRSYLALTLLLASVPLLSAQAGSTIDLRTDERELQRYEWRLQQDRNRLVFDRRNHAPKWQIGEDQAQVRRDRAAIRDLRADIRHDRHLRRRYRTL
jgi:hypothetical protein